MGKFIGLKLSILLLLCLAIAGCEVGHRVVPIRTVKIAILPDYSLHLMSEKYEGLLKYLSEETGYRFEPVSAMSYTTFLPALEGSKAQISFQNGLFFIILAKTKGAYPVAEALTIDGQSSSRGVIVTRRDSGISKLQDLKGKTVMVPSKQAVLGYIAEMSLLLDKGFNPQKDLNVVVGQRHDQVLRSVWQGRVDAGFVKEGALEEARDIVKLDDLRILAHTRYFPNWCFTAFPESDEEIVKRVKTALLKLNKLEHREILESAGIGGFVETSEDEYDIIKWEIQHLNLPY